MGTAEFIEEMKTVKDALELYLDMYDDDLPDKYQEKTKMVIGTMNKDIGEMEKTMNDCLRVVNADIADLKKANKKKSEQDSETLEEMIQKLKSADGIIQIPEDTGSVFFGHTDADVFKAYSRGMRDAADAAYYFSDELAEAQEELTIES